MAPHQCGAVEEASVAIDDTPERKALLSVALSATRAVPGDIVEGGVYRGDTLRFLAAGAGAGEGKVVWGLDSFRGFPPNNEEGKVGFADTTIESVQALLVESGLAARVRLVQGWFEETVPALPVQRVSLVHLDCDLGASYEICLNHLWPKLTVGGWMVFDEYGYTTKYPNVRPTVDHFFRGSPERVIVADAFRAFVVKHG